MASYFLLCMTFFVTQNAVAAISVSNLSLPNTKIAYKSSGISSTTQEFNANEFHAPSS